MVNAPQLSEADWHDLTSAGAYPGDPDAKAGIEATQTHISRVFLTRSHVYKFRKAVKLPFVDFSTRDARNADCLDEVRLNRRLAPDVYLGVAPLLRKAGVYQVGSVSESLAAGDHEHCVVMRRLPAGRDALSLLEAGRLGPPELDAAARTLATFHRKNALPPQSLTDSCSWIDGIERPVEECIETLRTCGLPGTGPGLARTLEAAVHGWVACASDRFEARRRAGRAVDGHGDLHLDHLWYEREGEPPVIIDCVEFEPALRQIDAASDVAFLAMDLRYRGDPGLAERFLRRYASEMDDFDLYGVVDFFAAYRAAVRAKVAAIAALDPSIEDQQRKRAARSAAEHADLALHLLRLRPRGSVVALCGPVGSGKSSVASHVADHCGGVVIASDQVRRVPGLATPDAASRYTSERVDAVYRAMLDRAEPVVASGRAAVLDATHALRAQRERVLEWSRRQGAHAWLVETSCEAQESVERLRRREAERSDPSEAGPGRHAASVAAFEPPNEWPGATHARIETTGNWRTAAESVAARVISNEGAP